LTLSAAERTSPAVTPPPGSPRFPGIDGLRGVAILLVVVCHTGLDAALDRKTGGWIWPRLSIGVVLFFAISGFLIYRPFVAAHAQRRSAPSLRRYARRRALRILPAYWLALTVLSLWPGTAGDVFGGNAWKFYGLVHIYGAETLTQGLGVTWSLCVELTFYALLPLFAWLVARLAGVLPVAAWWQAELAAVAAFGGAGIALCLPLVVSAWPTWLATTLAMTTSWFAVGMGLAVLSVAAERGGTARRVQTRMADRGGLLWLAALITFLASARLVWLKGQWPAISPATHVWPLAIGGAAERALQGLSAGLVLAPVVAGAGGMVRAVTTWRPLMVLGLISYGVFLWHYVAAGWISGRGVGVAAGPEVTGFGPLTILTLVVSVAVATVSYRLVELPLLRHKEPRGTGRRRAAAEPAQARVT
jgi:peptidoglycan/LPS O-acetylase OafA/YrhL